MKSTKKRGGRSSLSTSKRHPHQNVRKARTHVCGLPRQPAWGALDTRADVATKLSNHGTGAVGEGGTLSQRISVFVGPRTPPRRPGSSGFQELKHRSPTPVAPSPTASDPGSSRPPPPAAPATRRAPLTTAATRCPECQRGRPHQRPPPLRGARGWVNSGERYSLGPRCLPGGLFLYGKQWLLESSRCRSLLPGQFQRLKLPGQAPKRLYRKAPRHRMGFPDRYRCSIGHCRCI